jgi:hypothetical protein
MLLYEEPLMPAFKVVSPFNVELCQFSDGVCVALFLVFRI